MPNAFLDQIKSKCNESVLLRSKFNIFGFYMRASAQVITHLTIKNVVFKMSHSRQQTNSKRAFVSWDDALTHPHGRHRHNSERKTKINKYRKYKRIDIDTILSSFVYPLNNESCCTIQCESVCGDIDFLFAPSNVSQYKMCCFICSLQFELEFFAREMRTRFPRT